MDIRNLLRRPNESGADYFRRLRYGCLRRVVPSLREQFRLESLTGPRNCWDQLTAYQIAILKDIGLKPNHTLLDIGCGPISGGLNVISYLDKGNYVGVDISHEPLLEAYRLIYKHKLAHKNPLLLHSETFGKNELNGQKFDIIWVSQLLYHLDDDQTTQLFEHLKGHMKKDGKIAGDIIAESEWRNVPSDARWRNFSFHLRLPSYYQSLAEKYNLSCTIHGTLRKYGYPEKEGLKHNHILILS